jgi:hypothetical protein
MKGIIKSVKQECSSFLVNLLRLFPMKRYLISSLLVLFASFLFGQSSFRECATVASQSWVAYLKANAAGLQAANFKKSAPVQIPYRVHLFMREDSTSNLTLQDIYHEMDTVNDFYANANMFFYECEPAEIIYDDSLYNFNSNPEEPILLNNHYTPDVLNLYFPNTAYSGNTPVCGYSRFPPSVDIAIIAAGCAKNGSTLPHEIGHYFGLLHTHETFFGAELVDGSNCSSAGDVICDTPADPGLDYTNVNLTCAYTGTVVDGNSMAYVPDVTNIMSYSRKECRFYFSPMQYAVLNNTMDTERNYLFCSFGLGVADQDAGGNVALFPNPGTNELTVSLKGNSAETEFNLYDAVGREVFSDKNTLKEYRINTSELNSGIYFYTLKIAGYRYHGKWMKY